MFAGVYTSYPICNLLTACIFHFMLDYLKFAGLEDVLKTALRHVLKTSSTRLQCDNFRTSKKSWRRLAKTSWRHLASRLEDVLKKSWRTTSCYVGWRGLQDVSKTYWRHVMKTSWIDVLKRCLEDVLKTYLEDFLETLGRNKMLTGDICI